MEVASLPRGYWPIGFENRIRGSRGHLRLVWLAPLPRSAHFLPRQRQLAVETDFVVVGRQKSLCCGALIGPNSLFASLSLLVILKFVPHTVGRCCCNKHQHETPRAQQYTCFLVPCAHGKLNVKHYQTTPKPETQITREVVKKLRCGEKIENRAPQKRIQATQPPPPASRQQATQLLGGTCTRMSASCCCCCRTVLLSL